MALNWVLLTAQAIVLICPYSDADSFLPLESIITDISTTKIRPKFADKSLSELLLYGTENKSF